MRQLSVSFLGFVSLHHFLNYTWHEASESRYFWFCSFFYLVKWFEGLLLHNFLWQTDFSGMCWRYTKCNYRWQKKSNWFSGYSSRSQPKGCHFLLFPGLVRELLSTPPAGYSVCCWVNFFCQSKIDNATWNHKKAVHKIKEQVRKTILPFT